MASLKSILLIGVLVLALLIGYFMMDRFDENSLKRKRVLVTGSSTGIGEQMAYHYARYGAKVVVTGRNETKLQEVVKKMQQLGGSDRNYHYVVADMAKMSDAKKVIRVAVDKLLGLDILVLNHVYHHSLGYWWGTDANLTQLDTGFEVNFKSYVHLVSHARPFLQRTQGRIVVISSILGKLSMAQTVPYNAAKFALEGFFNGLRQEFIMREKNVSVTICFIGLTSTEAVMKNLEYMKKGDKFFNFVTLSKPVDVALAIVKAGALRQRELHYPYWQAKLASVLRDICPTPLEYLGRYMVQLQ